MKTLIIGKDSNLTNFLVKEIKDSNIFSFRELIENTDHLEEFLKKKKVNIIINGFYPAKNITTLNNYEDYVLSSVLVLTKILNIFKLHLKVINKIVYSSSASAGHLYDSQNENLIFDKNNRNLNASNKLLCENIIKNFCQKNNLSFVIARIFNMYGGDDNFSIISKIIFSNKKKNKLLINNEGKDFRDFIHVSDVAKTYKKILNNSFSGYLDIGQGKAYKIIDILKLVQQVKFKFKKDIFSKTNILVSCANNSDQKQKIVSNTVDIIKFLKKKVKLKKDRIFFINNFQNQLLHNNYIIYGAGNAGLQTKSILENYYNEKIVFFVDDDKNKIGKIINGIQIISYKELLSFYDNKIPKKIIVAIPSLIGAKRTKLAKKILSVCNNLSFLPEKRGIFRNRVDPLDLRNIEFNDIFPSKNINFNSNLDLFFKNKSVLITGAAGSIGSELCRQIINYEPKNLVAIDKSEIGIYNLRSKIIKYSSKRSKNVFFYLQDILETQRNITLINKHQIDVVIHAAANKHVSILEENISEAIKNNVLGTISILNSLNKNVKNLIFVSTDKAVKPKSILGITKRLSEIFVLNHFYCTGLKHLKANVVRFGNVFASDGSVIHLFIKQILNNNPVTITNKNVRRYFMSITDACYLIINTLKLNVENSVLVFKMGKDYKIIDIIYKLARYLKVNFNKIVIQEIGLQKGEKLQERLSYSNKFFKTKFFNILKSKESLISNKENILRNIQYLENNYLNMNKINLLKTLKLINFYK